MIRRLVDAHYYQNRDEPTEARARFWLRESRTPEMLIRVAAENPEITQQMIQVRPLLTETLAASRRALAAELEIERVLQRMNYPRECSTDGKAGEATVRPARRTASPAIRS